MKFPVFILILVPLIGGENSRLELREVSLEKLFSLKIASASGILERLQDAPATMVVVTKDDIAQRGYKDLTELVADLPGFDTVVTHGTTHFVTYQRGYRTPFSQRTLFMVNGIIENHLWSHVAIISRQYPMTSIDRVEVLYGPAGAVYGPNAFLGVINIITRDPSKLPQGEHDFKADIQQGSYGTTGLDLKAEGNFGSVAYMLAGKFFESDEPSLEDLAPWGFATEDWLGNQTAWGPVLDYGHRNKNYGNYYDPSTNWGIVGEIKAGHFTLGTVQWETDEGYGMYYAFDRVQPNQSWIHDGKQYYLKYQEELAQGFSFKAMGKYHTNRLHGGWAEAIPDWRPELEDYSFVSISDWDSANKAWKFRADFDFEPHESLRLTGGVKFEKKRLTTAYDVCGYWAGSTCSSSASDLDESDLDRHLGAQGNPGNAILAENLGVGIFHSSVSPADFFLLPGTSGQIPDILLVDTTDKGAFLQAIYTRNKWRLQSALRWDNNSIYGTFIKPRVSAIFSHTPRTIFKFIYGEAFQEPAPLQLWGGWTGRAANPDLKPEEMKNLESIFLYQAKTWTHEVSLYQAHYENVIKEEAENAGDRDVWGLEYRGRFSFPNRLSWLGNLTGYFNYTYNNTKSSISYDHELGSWVDQSSDLGDIAPHKVNAGLNTLVGKHWDIHLRANHVSSRTLYSRNPLRAQGLKAEPYTVFHLNATLDMYLFSLNFKINNLFDALYYHPGPEQADSGNDFTQRSKGFRNSLVPQERRSFMISLSTNF